MALLQISEPGESPAPHQRRVAIGIDLGTTNSLVAVVRNGSAEVLSDEAGRGLLPSVVRYEAADSGDTGGRTTVGIEAQRHLARDPRNTISSVKRFMGRAVADVPNIENAPYDFIDAPGMLKLRTIAGPKSPVEVSAEILKALRYRAEAQLLGGSTTKLAGAVVTVPAYFDDAQRQATKDAAKLAGLDVLRLLNEPTAAAVAYGLDNAAEGIYAVYDLGGGTFDISILRLSKGVFEVLSTGGDSALGGDDFDHRLYCWALDESRLTLPTPEDTRLLLLKSREAKEHLTLQGVARINADLADGRRINVTASQAKFFEITQHLVQKTIGPVKKALRDAGLSVDDVKGVVMVGGATRMPHVQRAVAQLFGKPPLNNLDPDMVVALGAAMQADQLAGNRTGGGAGDDWLLLDVIPLSLGIETMGGLVEKIIARNSTIPVARSQEFTTFKDGQTAMAIHVLQGEREKVSDCRSLGRFELRGIPPLVAGAARIEVTFAVDADGLLSVAAREETTGVESTIAVKPSYGLSDTDITRMLEESFQKADEDKETRALTEVRVEAEQLIAAVAAALLQDGDLVDHDERSVIDRAMAELSSLVSSSDRHRIKRAFDALGAATATFAQRRMDRGVRSALTGHHIKELA